MATTACQDDLDRGSTIATYPAGSARGCCGSRERFIRLATRITTVWRLIALLVYLA
jgi:hypothetical protein